MLVDRPVAKALWLQVLAWEELWEKQQVVWKLLLLHLLVGMILDEKKRHWGRMDKTHESPMSATFLLPTAVALIYLQAVSPRAGVYYQS